ncbi:MAG: diguanylate cyclase, partial [Mycobacterium sp.]|nr:diguanylate cyclase [Mycobacterium sp.]
MKRWRGNPWRRIGLTPRVGRLVASFYGAAGLTVVAASLLDWRGPDATRPANEIVTVMCLLPTAACAGYAARSATGRHRFGWLALLTAV